MKIEVTENFLMQVLKVAKDMRNNGTYDNKSECEKVIKNTKSYLKKHNIKQK